MVKFNVWLVSRYVSVFKLLSVVRVAAPLAFDKLEESPPYTA